MRKTIVVISTSLLSGLFIPQAMASNFNKIKQCERPGIEVVRTTLGLNDPTSPLSLHALKLLFNKTYALHPAVIDKVITTIQCAKHHGTDHNHVLTVIDFSLPSSKKRLWVFDLKNHRLLYHTYVSHGIKSGFLLSNYFSNQHNSKASSIGVFKTDRSYYGRHGLSLKLTGLERRFNDNAFNRAIVMHGGWYVNESFIKKYGRAGRSWGCPALPKSLTKPIINTIKDSALFVAYYPNEQWFIQSNYLNCGNYSKVPLMNPIEKNDVKPLENRDAILYAIKNKNNYREEYEPIVAMSADNYKLIFKNNVPLKRMLRRQIDEQEFVALNPTEFNNISSYQRNNESNYQRKNALNNIVFIIPEVKKVRGYYATEMKIIPYGQITRVITHDDTNHSSTYTIHFNKAPSIELKTTHQFIRWLGL